MEQALFFLGWTWTHANLVGKACPNQLDWPALAVKVFLITVATNSLDLYVIT